MTDSIGDGTAEEVRAYTKKLSDRITTLEEDSGGALTGFSSSLDTEAPNDEVNASGLTASGGTTDQDVYVAPKGNGALIGQEPDGTFAGGNKRGIKSVDFQLSRDDASQVASGDYSSIWGGRNNIVSGNYATVTHGSGNVADSDWSKAGGLAADTQGIIGNDVNANGSFGDSAGDGQISQLALKAKTTDGTPVVLRSNADAASATNQVSLSAKQTRGFHGWVIAADQGSSDSSYWKFEGAIIRPSNAASTALVASVTPSNIAHASGASAWSVAVTADTTNGALKITVTGEAGKNIQWVCRVQSEETIIP